MRFVSLEVPGAVAFETRLGCVRADGSVIDLNAAYRRLLELRRGLEPAAAARVADVVVPTSMRAFIEGGSLSLEAAAETLESVEEIDNLPDVFASGTRRLAPLPDPPLIRDFMAFEEHLQNIYPRLGREIPAAWYELPVYYKGNPSSVAGPGDPVTMPSYSDDIDFDFEFEIAAVIGRGGADIAAEDAAEHIFGYMIYNDFSARAIQQQEMSVGLGPAKGKDFRGGHVFGPCLVTADEVPDIYDLEMRAEVNGREWCRSNTSTMHWRFEDMIAHASRDEYLRPAEILGSGTVGGGSAAERGGSLAAGDTVALTVDVLGTLTTEVRSGRRNGGAG
jgi:2-keto-4-pentenoate hydratase/2-oxohepta-3-ene-1,7-dioic acid hydratase in catechol pathway